LASFAGQLHTVTADGRQASPGRQSASWRHVAAAQIPQSQLASLAGQSHQKSTNSQRSPPRQSASSLHRSGAQVRFTGQVQPGSSLAQAQVLGPGTHA